MNQTDSFRRRWDDLDAFLNKLDVLETGGAATKAELGAEGLGLVRMASDADRFQLSIGKLLLSMRKRQDSAFQADLLQARIQVRHC